MTILTEIQRIKNDLSDCYTAISNAGGTLPTTKNLNNLSSAIKTVPCEGYTELPRYTISGNTLSSRTKVLDGTEFSKATSIGDYGLYFGFYNDTGISGVVDLSNLESIGQYGLHFTFYNCSGITNLKTPKLKSIGNYGCQYGFYYCTSLSSVDLSKLTDIGVYGCGLMFEGCSALTSADLSGLTVLDSGEELYYTFKNCTSLTSVDLSALTSMSGTWGCEYMCSGCTALTTIDLNSLTSVTSDWGCGYMFNGCTALKTLHLDSIAVIASNYTCAYMFQNCTSLEDVYFGNLTESSFGTIYKNQFYSMLSGTGSTTTHTLHFPVGMEETIAKLTGYPLFSGTSGYVVLKYDLNGCTIIFTTTSSGTPTYYIGGKAFTSGSMITLNDTTYIISSTEGIVTNALTNLERDETRTITTDMTTKAFNTITLNTGLSDCTVTFTVNGVEFSPTTTSGTNYILKINSDSTQSIEYTAKKKGYARVSGTLTYTGSNITETITMPEASTSIELQLTPGTTSYGWQATTVTNPTSYTMVESTNKGVSSSYAVMKVVFSGYSTLTCYINSYGESSFDYTIISTLDASSYPTTSSSTTAYANTSGKQYDPTTFNTTNWTTVAYSGLDEEEHFFYVVYRKDGSVDSNNDRGYFIIDTNQ